MACRCTGPAVDCFCKREQEKEKPLVFVPGKKYEDRNGLVYTCAADVAKYGGRERIRALLFVRDETGLCVFRYPDGKCDAEMYGGADIIREHVEMEEISVEVGVWRNSAGNYNAAAAVGKLQADYVGKQTVKFRVPKK